MGEGHSPQEYIIGGADSPFNFREVGAVEEVPVGQSVKRIRFYPDGACYDFKVAAYDWVNSNGRIRWWSDLSVPYDPICGDSK